MATKLGVYNQTLAALGDSVPLASLEENRAARRFLDLQWDNGLIEYCLEQEQWGFATRPEMLTASNSIIPAFGYEYAFEVPDDFMGLNSLWIDPEFQSALEVYEGPDAGVIYCNEETIYIKYVSNFETYGGNIAKWPKVFERFVIARLANLGSPLIVNNFTTEQKLAAAEIKARLTAANWDKRNKPRQNLPMGNWSKAALGAYGFWGRAVNY